MIKVVAIMFNIHLKKHLIHNMQNPPQIRIFLGKLHNGLNMVF
jgi:hypothetical protein